jgi:hypothetical protein
MMAQSHLGKDVREEAMGVLSAGSVVGLKMLENRRQDNEWLAGSYVMVTFALNYASILLPIQCGRVPQYFEVFSAHWQVTAVSDGNSQE